MKINLGHQKLHQFCWLMLFAHMVSGYTKVSQLINHQLNFINHGFQRHKPQFFGVQNYM